MHSLYNRRRVFQDVERRTPPDAAITSIHISYAPCAKPVIPAPFIKVFASGFHASIAPAPVVIPVDASVAFVVRVFLHLDHSSVITLFDVCFVKFIIHLVVWLSVRVFRSLHPFSDFLVISASRLFPLCAVPVSLPVFALSFWR